MEIKRRRYLRLYIRTDVPNDDDTIGLYGLCEPKVRKIIKREPRDDDIGKTGVKKEVHEGGPPVNADEQNVCVKREPADAHHVVKKRRLSKKTSEEVAAK